MDLLHRLRSGETKDDDNRKYDNATAFRLLGIHRQTVSRERAIRDNEDPDPVSSAIGLRGISFRPPSPVHGRSEFLADGSLRLCWTRRARGSWLWRDGVDTPLVEEAERYLVSYGALASPVTNWTVTTNEFQISPSEIADLEAVVSGGSFHVRQLGSYAMSEPSFVTQLARKHNKDKSHARSLHLRQYQPALRPAFHVCRPSSKGGLGKRGIRTHRWLAA